MLRMYNTRNEWHIIEFQPQFRTETQLAGNTYIYHIHIHKKYMYSLYPNLIEKKLHFHSSMI